MARLRRKGCEADPHSFFLPERIRPYRLRRRLRIVEDEAQTAQHVAITHDGMFERRGGRIRTPQPEPLLDTPLVDARRRHSVQPEQQADDARTQHPVHVGHGVDSPPPRLAGQTQQPEHPLVAACVVGFQKIDVQPREERLEERPREHRNANVGVRFAQCAKGVRHHRHIAHRRIADHQNMSRQLSIS